MARVPLMCALWGLSASAWAASLDLPEVGGIHGTPAASGPTAVWWNPAMMSASPGTSFLIEVAPVIGSVTHDRTAPPYGDFGGTDSWGVVTAVPFAGFVTDAGVPGLGIGGAVYVPFARAGATPNDPGVGRTHLRSAQIQTIFASLAVSYTIADIVGIGIAGTYVNATYRSVNDVLAMPDLADAAPTLFGIPCPEQICNDAALEDPVYLVKTDFQDLVAHKGSMQTGFFVRPHPRWTISVGFSAGVPNVEHVNRVRLTFDCPPETTDFLQSIFRTQLQSQGLCTPDGEGAVFDAYGSNTYSFPMRLHGGLRFQPTDDIGLELMGGWVRWSQFEDFRLVVKDVESLNTEITPQTAGLLTQDRLWARGNRDSFWVGVDGKFKVHELVRVDGRIGFDRAAVPDAFMSPNNADFDTLKLMAGLEVRVSKKVPFFIGASFLENVHFARTVTDNGFSVTLDPEARVEERLYYPEMNGAYAGQTHRFGVSLRGDFQNAPKR